MKNPFASRNRAPTTMFQQSLNDIELEGGRFAAIDKPVVVGCEPAVHYPAASDWSSDPSGIEPPTNQEIDAQEPTGTPVEVERSLELAAPSPSPVDDATSVEATGPAGFLVSSPDVDPASTVPLAPTECRCRPTFRTNSRAYFPNS